MSVREKPGKIISENKKYIDMESMKIVVFIYFLKIKGQSFVNIGENSNISVISMYSSA